MVSENIVFPHQVLVLTHNIPRMVISDKNMAKATWCFWYIQ